MTVRTIRDASRGDVKVIVASNGRMFHIRGFRHEALTEGIVSREPESTLGEKSGTPNPSKKVDCG